MEPALEKLRIRAVTKVGTGAKGAMMNVGTGAVGLKALTMVGTGAGVCGEGGQSEKEM